LGIRWSEEPRKRIAAKQVIDDAGSAMVGMQLAGADAVMPSIRHSSNKELQLHALGNTPDTPARPAWQHP